MNEDVTSNPSSLSNATRPTFRIDGAPETRLNATLIDVMSVDLSLPWACRSALTKDNQDIASSYTPGAGNIW